jgi:hypothetical protein
MSETGAAGRVVAATDLIEDVYCGDGTLRVVVEHYG